MKFEKQEMVKWYNVKLLASTGVKTIISSIFGNFADKREMQAALSQEEEFDYTGTDNLWVDYISDLGDGFDSSYTMAHLLAQKELIVKDSTSSTTIPRGSILIMGGDQVYPTPEKKEYENRLQGPYHAAFPKVPVPVDITEQARGIIPKKFHPSSEHPFLFAIPGNHDWYDGLSNFMKIFCQERSMGNWKTAQKRSYFALKLPHGCWLWGIDVQLESDIDKPQLEYFTQIANRMEAKDYIILCTAEPAWVYHSVDKKSQSFDKLDFFVNRVFREKPEDQKSKVAAILTGDMHHYSRYEHAIKKDNSVRHLITAGGGGAFLHPTHFLKDKIDLKDGDIGTLQKTFPSKKESVNFAFRNLLFPFYNQWFPLTIGFAFVILAWFLQTADPHVLLGMSLMKQLSFIENPFTSLWEFSRTIFHALQQSPIALIFNFLIIMGFVSFADTKSEKGKWCYIASTLLAIFQMIAFYLLFWFFSRTNLHCLKLVPGSLCQIALFFFEMLLVGSLISSLIFGKYLLITNLLLKAHATEAFSSFRGTGFKNFLRMRITPEGVTVFPIGVRKVVKWEEVKTDNPGEPKFKGADVNYELIEPPIHIKK